MILFDEIEKAHSDVFNILLQLLDDGRLTDSQGRTVNFKNTVIIMTSNIGSRYLLEGIDQNGEITEEAKEAVHAEMRRSFRPEFLNRIDEIVLFKPLSQAEIIKIIDLAMKDIQRRLSDRDIQLVLTEKAKERIAGEAYSSVYGARPVKRYLQKHVETEIAKRIIQGDIQDGDRVMIDADEKGLKIEKEAAAQK